MSIYLAIPFIAVCVYFIVCSVRAIWICTVPFGRVMKDWDAAIAMRDWEWSDRCMAEAERILDKAAPRNGLDFRRWRS